MLPRPRGGWCRDQSGLCFCLPSPGPGPRRRQRLPPPWRCLSVAGGHRHRDDQGVGHSDAVAGPEPDGGGAAGHDQRGALPEPHTPPCSLRTVRQRGEGAGRRQPGAGCALGLVQCQLRPVTRPGGCGRQRHYRLPRVPQPDGPQDEGTPGAVCGWRQRLCTQLKTAVRTPLSPAGHRLRGGAARGVQGVRQGRQRVHLRRGGTCPPHAGPLLLLVKPPGWVVAWDPCHRTALTD